MAWGINATKKKMMINGQTKKKKGNDKKYTVKKTI
jgi:hypothetical protein